MLVNGNEPAVPLASRLTRSVNILVLVGLMGLPSLSHSCTHAALSGLSNLDYHLTETFCGRVRTRGSATHACGVSLLLAKDCFEKGGRHCHNGGPANALVGNLQSEYF